MKYSYNFRLGKYMYTYTKSVEKRPKDVVEQELLKSAGLLLNHLKNKKANIVENIHHMQFLQKNAQS